MNRPSETGTGWARVACLLSTGMLVAATISGARAAGVATDATTGPAGAGAGGSVGASGGNPGGGAVQRLTLQEASRLALLGNRELQIQRIQPEIARVTLDAAMGYYDPQLTWEVRRENTADTGGFDPADLSRDAVYSARSDVSRLGLSGFLPGGMSYLLDGNYARSSGDRNGLNFDSYKVTAGVLVQQPLLKNLWMDPGRHVVQIRRRDLRMTEFALEHLVQLTLRDVRLAYIELQAARETWLAQSALADTRRRLLAGVQRRVAEGVATAPDERLARSQVAMAEVDVTGASNAMQLAGHALKTLMGDPFTQPVDRRVEPADALVAVPTSWNLVDSYERGVARRPDLAQLREDVTRADVDLRFRRNQLWPALDVVAGYRRQGVSASQVLPPDRPRASLGDARDQWADGDSPSDLVGLVLTVPLSRTVERANHRASRHWKEQAELRVRQREELVYREISDAVAGAQGALARWESARRARQDAAAALEDEERRLAGGRSNLFFVLQLQEGLVRARLAEIRAVADYNLGMAQLEFAEGTLLEKSGLSLQVR